MTKDVIYERTDGNRMYRIVNGDTTDPVVTEVFVIQLFEDGQHTLTSAPFVTIDAAKKRINENINNLRAYRLRARTTGRL